ncbi:retrovirus-related pol polyprotein from transposon TNT 1-94 [Tanacetum coccineum]
MTPQKDDQPAAGGIGINNGMNDTTVIPLPGASHHMTSIIEDLSNLKEIVQWPVELPDGNIAMAKKEGDDLTSRTVIGASERMNGGLFYFREMPPTRAFKTITTLPFDLWHKRLGHPSQDVLKLLPQGQKGWRLFDLEKLEFFVSRDVDFLEHIFPYDTEPIVPSVNDNEYNDTGLHEEPPSQDRG